MKKAEESDLATPNAGHFVPSTAAVLEDPTPTVRVESSAKLDSRPGESFPSYATGPVSSGLSRMNLQEIANPGVLPDDSVKIRPALNLEPIQALIGNWAVDVRRARADGMEVVLKPNAQTELSLRFSLQHGWVEVAAEVRRGDVTGLNAHWAQLQQSLSSQGIRLGAIQPSSAGDSAGQTGVGGSNQFHHQSTPEPEFPELLDQKPGFISAHSARQNKTGTPTSTLKRVWESWA